MGRNVQRTARLHPRPTSKDIKHPSQSTEQCLSPCGTNCQNKVIEESTLIFIRDGETPIATAELDNKAKKEKLSSSTETRWTATTAFLPENAKIALEMFHKQVYPKEKRIREQTLPTKGEGGFLLSQVKISKKIQSPRWRLT